MLVGELRGRKRVLARDLMQRARGKRAARVPDAPPRAPGAACTPVPSCSASPPELKLPPPSRSAGCRGRTATEGVRQGDFALFLIKITKSKRSQCELEPRSGKEDVRSEGCYYELCLSSEREGRTIRRATCTQTATATTATALLRSRIEANAPGVFIYPIPPLRPSHPKCLVYVD